MEDTKLGKSLQIKKPSNEKVFQAMVAAGIYEYKQLQAAVEKDLQKTFKYQTFMKVISGNLMAGPKAEAIMKAVSKRLNKPAEELWPELKDRVA